MTVPNTVQLLSPFVQIADVREHFSSLFAVPPGGIHNKKKVEVHVRRTAENIAYPMRDPSAGWHYNERQGWSKKELEPAVYKEAFAIAADDLMGDQEFGMNPYENSALMARAQNEIGISTQTLRDIIRRGLELQAAQIMTTGALSLVDDSGAVVFAENFAPKATHFFNASTAWTTTATAVPITDIANGCDLNKRDGKRMSKRVHFNSVTFEEMRATDSFKAALDRDYKMDNGEVYRINSGAQPVYDRFREGGGIFRGVIQARNYVLDMYTYDEEYNHPQTGTITKYCPDHKAVIESGGRMDATFGRINNFGTDGRAQQYLARGRMTNESRMVDLTIIAWVTDDGTVFNVGVGTRGLLFPVEIDSFCCITTSGF